MHKFNRSLIANLIFLFFLGCSSQQKVAEAPVAEQKVYETLPLEIPQLRANERVTNHTGFSLSFDKDNRVPRWVAYHLTPTKIKTKSTERTNKFLFDKDVEGCPFPEEYKGTKYDRGHLAPAEDMRWSIESMKDSFYMSNMTPQKPKFNRGIWKKLEGKVREWASEYENVYIVSGPVLKEPCENTISHHICVPKQFFKVILKKTGADTKAIGFLIPQDYSDANLSSYTHSVHEVEQATGLNFFPSLQDDVENKVETATNFDEWMGNNNRKHQLPIFVASGNVCPNNTKLMSATIKGCCSGHGGVSGPKKGLGCCGSDHKITCNDGTKSRSCRCN